MLLIFWGGCKGWGVEGWGREMLIFHSLVVVRRRSSLKSGSGDSVRARAVRQET